MQLLQNHVVTCSAYLVGFVVCVVRFSSSNERQEGGKWLAPDKACMQESRLTHLQTSQS